MILRTLMIFLLLPAGALAEVLDAADGGFTVEHRIVAAATRDEAWRAVVTGIGEWWSGEHTVSGDASNLYINAVPQGCFCERLGERGGLVHLMVTFINPGVLLRLTGGLGPLGLLGTNGNLTFEFEEPEDDGSKTAVILRYAVGGYRPGGLGALASPVDTVLGEQLERLAAYLGSDGPAG